MQIRIFPLTLYSNRVPCRKSKSILHRYKVTASQQRIDSAALPKLFRYLEIACARLHSPFLQSPNLSAARQKTIRSAQSACAVRQNCFVLWPRHSVGLRSHFRKSVRHRVAQPSRLRTRTDGFRRATKLIGRTRKSSCSATTRFRPFSICLSTPAKLLLKITKAFCTATKPPCQTPDDPTMQSQCSGDSKPPHRLCRATALCLQDEEADVETQWMGTPMKRLLYLLLYHVVYHLLLFFYVPFWFTDV